MRSVAFAGCLFLWGCEPGVPVRCVRAVQYGSHAALLRATPQQQVMGRQGNPAPVFYVCVLYGARTARDSLPNHSRPDARVPAHGFTFALCARHTVRT